MLVGGQLIATSSTMFANPQVTFARMFTYAAAGVKPFDGAVFILMEIIGAVTRRVGLQSSDREDEAKGNRILHCFSYRVPPGAKESNVDPLGSGPVGRTGSCSYER